MSNIYSMSMKLSMFVFCLVDHIHVCQLRNKRHMQLVNVCVDEMVRDDGRVTTVYNALLLHDACMSQHDSDVYVRCVKI